MMELNESIKGFLEAVLVELDKDDAAAMFTFLGNVIKTNPGKLNKIATKLKDPKTMEEIQALGNTKNKVVLMTKIGTLYKKFA